MLTFLTIALLHLLAIISPGPDFALMVRNAFSYSKKTAICSAAGLAVSVLVHCTYCVLGLAVVIANSIVAFNIIKFIGVAYLLYMGIKALRAKKEQFSVETATTKATLSNFAAFGQGILCNLLNPKATLFFLGIFTLVVKPHTPLFMQFLYSIEMGLMTFMWFSLVAMIVGHHRIKQKMSRIQHIVSKVFGGFLVAFGCKLAFISQ